MTNYQVMNFLHFNGWIFDNVSDLYTHPLIHYHVMRILEINNNPNVCVDSAIDWMNANKIIIKHTAESLAYVQFKAHITRQLTGVALAQTQNIKFNNKGNTIARKNYYSTYIITCDCGAVKCKTTHSHWCSTMKGNQNGR